MAYVATRGGEQAMRHAEQFFRTLNGPVDTACIRLIQRHMPYLIDRIMGEASLYAPELAALALVQTGGDLYEAVLLLRAYRSTQPRLAYAIPIESEQTLTVRRISAAFQDVPGGQMLGPTLDYSHRLLQTELLDPTQAPPPRVPMPEADTAAPRHYQPVTTWQRLNGLLDAAPEHPPCDPVDIPDVTRQPVTFPAPRAQRLQLLARADTGGLLTLGYAGMNGYGITHPTVNELCLAYADVYLRNPLTGTPFSAGRVRISQAEIVTPFRGGEAQLGLGFAATMGWNEVKVIAAAMLDLEMDGPDPHPAHQEAFVLTHTEAVEASGFCIHYKLPHYVTFQSNLDSLRRAQTQASHRVPATEQNE
ncbi:MAG: carbon-phosphorus lyase complex subunit PhnI [Chloroflexaceae bacterium]|nr:carbon-phosphorus lyase complex subunit PhnI [Chloroflexaceae bacterium]